MLTLEKAKKVIEATEKKARELKIAVCVTVVDTSGILVAMHRMDGAFATSPIFSQAKAITSGTLGLPTEEIAKYSAQGKPYYGVESLSSGKFTSIAGGIPIIEEKVLIGGVGVGGSYDVNEDATCAKAGAEVIK